MIPCTDSKLNLLRIIINIKNIEIIDNLESETVLYSICNQINGFVGV